MSTTAKVGSLAAVALVVVLALFQPWKLFVNETVNEALPGAQPVGATQTPIPSTSTPSTSTPSTPTPSTTPSVTPSATPKSTPTPKPTPPASPVVLAKGSFRSYDHSTTGTAFLIKLTDGKLIVRLENLDTSNGPDVHVWLSPAAVGGDASGLSAGHIDLGTIKGNKGNANYSVPAGLDPTKYKSVALWCERFSVAFGVATVQ